uniref:Uncharacterized protein n=1 Tax=Corticoviridae sp. TaxID=2832474 RepID=A0A8D9UHD4_9VIRU|nr:MAG TPA: hypothetical protein [Corticoviridae sp.]
MRDWCGRLFRFRYRYGNRTHAAAQMLVAIIVAGECLGGAVRAKHEGMPVFVFFDFRVGVTADIAGCMPDDFFFHFRPFGRTPVSVRPMVRPRAL